MREYAKASPALYTGTLGAAIAGDMDCLALAPYLIFGPHSNMIGLYRLPLAYIAEDLGMPSARASEALRKLSERGFCRYDERSKTVWVIEYARHEWGDHLNANDNRVKSLIRHLPKLLSDVANSSLSLEFAERYGNGWAAAFDAIGGKPRSPSEALAKPFPSPRGYQEQDQEQDQKQEETSSLRSEVCAESAEPTHAPPGAPEGEVRIDPVVMEFPVDGNAKEPTWQLRASKVAEWSKSFPSLDVTAQLRLARQWILDNPSRRKTAGGMPRFLGSWLSRAQNQGPPQHQRSGSGSARPAPPGLVTSPWPDETRPHGTSRSTGKGWEQWDANAKQWRPMASAASTQPQPQSGAVA